MPATPMLIRTRQRKNKPFSVTEPPVRDERVSDKVWGLPRRVETANRDGGFNYSQLQLAQAAELSQSLLSNLAAYHNLYGVRLDSLEKLAKALNVTLGWLLGEEPAIDSIRLARQAAAMLTELDGLSAEDAWSAMRDVDPASETADGYYVAAKRLLAGRVGLSAEDLATHKIKAGKLFDGSKTLSRRHAR